MRPAALSIALAWAVALSGLAPTPARAWSPLGHRIIAETAAILLERRHAEEGTGWGQFLSRHRFQLGFYSTVPDSTFKFVDGKGGNLEGPTHGFDVTLIAAGTPPGWSVLEPIPRDYAGARARLHARLGAKVAGEALERVGTAPWRVEQFLSLAWREVNGVRAVEGSYVTGAQARGDAAKLYRALVFLGLASHYTGDGTMPYHATGDSNGWATGQGGIHYFIENDCVNALEPGLSDRVLERAARKWDDWLKAWSVRTEPPAGVMMRVFAESLSQLETFARIDREKAVLEASVEPKGSRADDKSKRFARRKPAAEACPPLRDPLVDALAKASVLTAYLWDLVLPRAADFSRAVPVLFADFDPRPKFVAPNYRDLPAWKPGTRGVIPFSSSP